MMQVIIALMGGALIAIGLYFAVQGHGQEGEGSAGARGVVVKGPPWLILVAIGVGLVVFSAIWDFADEQTTTAEGSSTGGQTAGPTTAASSTVSPGTAAPTSGLPTTATPATASPTTSTPTTAAAGCRVTISNSLATIKETPDVFGQDIVSVPAGEYAVIEIENIDFGGLQDQRWFLISVSGREGWIRDSTFDLEAKSPDCP